MGEIPRQQLALWALAIAAAHFARAQASPAGLWKTISDVDGKPTAVVEIRQADGEFVGVVKSVIRSIAPDATVIDLTHDLMTMEATGSYVDAKQMIEKMAVVRPPVRRVLDRLTGVPVDIEPRFVTAAAVARR